MQLNSQASIVINEPRQRVCDEFCRFENWPQWSSYFRVVYPEAGDWRFIHRSAQDIDLSFVLQAVQKPDLEYIDFATRTELEHNAVVEGRVEFADIQGNTRLTLALQGQVQSNSMLKGLSNWWSEVFVEPDKNVKVILEDFKAHFKGSYDRVLEVKQPKLPMEGSR